MYALLNEDQTALQDAVEALARSVGIANPVDLDDRDPSRAWQLLRSMGLLELRCREGDAPTASGVEVMVAAQSLGANLVPVPFIPAAVLTTELLAMAGAPSEWSAAAVSGEERYGLLLTDDLRDLAVSSAPETAVVWGDKSTTHVLALDDESHRLRLVRLTLDSPLQENASIDLTQGLWRIPQSHREVLDTEVEQDALDIWRALALSSICADTVGLMRRALEGAVAYSKERIAYGVPIGSFQAIQHMAAETLVSVEAAYGATCYAAWCVDEANPQTALLAARTAKAYCASVSRTTAENVMQIYGGVGQTWEHIAHFYTRRALLNSELFGNEGAQLGDIADTRLGGN